MGGLVPLLKKQLTGSKILFHILFWTFHWGIFAYGWYAFSDLFSGGVGRVERG